MKLMVQERDGAPPRISFVDLEDFRRVRSVSWHRRLLESRSSSRPQYRTLPESSRAVASSLRLSRREFIWARRPAADRSAVLATARRAREPPPCPRAAPRASGGAPAALKSDARRAAAARPLTTQTSAGRREAMAFSIRRREYDHHTEQVHAAGGASLRDLMLGLNDGLVASFAVTSGVAGAFTSGNIVVMAGLAEMLGGAVSMDWRPLSRRVHRSSSTTARFSASATIFADGPSANARKSGPSTAPRASPVSCSTSS